MMNLEWLHKAMAFEPAQEMQKRLAKRHETFAQYIVRVMGYTCPACGALPMHPCNERVSNSKRCGVQFHRARVKAAKDTVTKRFLDDEIDDAWLEEERSKS